MKKTLAVILLFTLALTMILCGCDKTNYKDEEEIIIKKTEIREDENTLTVVYEDGYEISYSITQPIEVFLEKDNTRSARAVGLAMSQRFTFTTSINGSQNGGFSLGTGEYHVSINGTGDIAYSTGDFMCSTGSAVIDGTISSVVVQSDAVSRYIEHDGKKYEDCTADLLKIFREKTTLIDFVKGYEEAPFDSIYAGGFTNFANLQAIILPTSIKTIKQKAFDGCDKLTTVYYCGTAEEWEKVELAETEVQDKDKDGDEKEDKDIQDEDVKVPVKTIPNLLTTCTVYFYSEQAPTEAGNYWHFVDGNPTAW